MADDGNCKGRHGGECDCFKNKKPPVGLRPKIISDQQRKVEIVAALKRYSAAEVAFPLEWVEELRMLIEVT